MSELHFNQIGSIIKDSQGKFGIGPIPTIGGPFSNAADYYRAWALSQNDNLYRGGKRDPFPERVSSVAEILSERSMGPFTISHPDFHYQNFIVDDDYNLLAVIDWDGASVRPIEFSAVLPAFISSLHPIFWEGGRLDHVKRRKSENILKAQQARYLSTMRAQAPESLAISQSWQSIGSLRTQLAYGMDLYQGGNLNPWEWLIDLLERVIKQPNESSWNYEELRGKLQ